MPKIAQVTVSVGKTVSKDFNSTRYDYSVTVDVDESDNVDAVIAEQTEYLKGKIRLALSPPKSEPIASDPRSWPAVPSA